MRPTVPTNPEAVTQVDVPEWQLDIDWMTQRALELLRRIQTLRESNRQLIELLREQERFLAHFGYSAAVVAQQTKLTEALASIEARSGDKLDR